MVDLLGTAFAGWLAGWLVVAFANLVTGPVAGWELCEPGVALGVDGLGFFGVTALTIGLTTFTTTGLVAGRTTGLATRTSWLTCFLTTERTATVTFAG